MNKIHIILFISFIFFSCIKKPVEAPIETNEHLDYESLNYIQKERKCIGIYNKIYI